MSNNQELNLYFVESFTPMLRNLNGIIIALTPEVCYRLDKEGIVYQIFEDFYDMSKRKEYGKQYNKNLFSWIDSFDGYLKNQFTDSFDKKINFVKLYGFYIKNMLDSFIICSKNILETLNKLKPSKIFLITESHSEQNLDWRLFNEKPDLSSSLLPIICKQKNIHYSIISVKLENIKSDPIFIKLKFFLQRGFKKVKWLLNGIYTQTIYLLFLFKRKKVRSEGRLKVYLIVRDEWIGNFSKDAIKAGNQVLYHTIYGPKKYLFYRKRRKVEIKNFHLGENTATLWKKIGEKCIKEYNPSKWPNSKAGIDLSPILNNRFLYFLQKICPIINVTAKRYESMFKKAKIDFVVCSYTVSPSDFGVMAAATLNPKVVSIRTEHGGGEIQDPIWYFSEQPTNIYLTSSKEEAIFFEEFFNYDNTSRTEVTAGSVWIDRYRNEARKILHRFSKSPKWEYQDKNRMQVYYLPSIQYIQRFNITYTLCWYYHLQKALYKHFKKLHQYNFIIKIPPLPWIKYLYSPLLKFLKDLKASNISYKKGDLVKNLREADRVITDYPSTPTYEARLMGLPVLSLYHESISVRQTAKQAYGKTLVMFKTTKEALKHINEFLLSNPEGYIVPMEDNYCSPTLLEILENLKTYA